MSPGVAAFSGGDARPAASAAAGGTPELLNAVLLLQHQQHHHHQESPSPPEDSPQLSPAEAEAVAAAAAAGDIDLDDIDGTSRPSVPLQKRRRVTRACDECRRKKIKCDGKQPCTHCTVYSYGMSRRHTVAAVKF
jgi:hypothetical protein